MPKPPGHQLQDDGVFDKAGYPKNGTTVLRYRKKPVVIEAFRLGHDMAFFPPWFTGTVTQFLDSENNYQLACIEVKTLEGTMKARPGDWIIKGVDGELYPCKHEIFVKTYEEA